VEGKPLDLFVPEKSTFPRSKRAAKEVKRLLSEIFQKQDVPPFLGPDQQYLTFPGQVTITDVKISNDLKECTVSIVSLANSRTEDVEAYFCQATSLIRKIFARKSTLRFVPHFTFRLDDSFLKVAELEKLLQALSKGQNDIDEQKIDRKTETEHV
jgi:ribosome-binding factor A